MRVLHVVEATCAGVGRHVVDLTTVQVDRGLDVHIAYSPTREGEAFRQARLAAGGASWHPVTTGRWPRLGDRRALAELRRLVRALGPDVVHGHSTKGGLLARLVDPGPARVVYTPNAVYSMNPRLGAPTRSLVAGAERWLSRRTDALIAVSPEEAGHLGDIGVPPEKIHLVPNGIPAIERSEARAVRRALGLDPGRPVVGFVGRLGGQKAPDDLLRIFAQVARSAGDAQFVVVGDGPMRDALERGLADDSVLAGRLHIVGERPGPWAMSGFDLLVLPSRYEGFPYVLIEAAHVGLPIVTTVEASASLLLSGPAEIRVSRAGEVAELAGHCLDLLDIVGDPAARPFGRDRRFTAERMEELTAVAYGFETVGSRATTERRVQPAKG